MYEAIKNLAILYRPAEGVKRCRNCYQYLNGICLMWKELETDPAMCCSVFLVNRELEICKHCFKPLSDHVDGRCESGKSFVDAKQIELF